MKQFVDSAAHGCQAVPEPKIPRPAAPCETGGFLNGLYKETIVLVVCSYACVKTASIAPLDLDH